MVRNCFCGCDEFLTLVAAESVGVLFEACFQPEESRLPPSWVLCLSGCGCRRWFAVLHGVPPLGGPGLCVFAAPLRERRRYRVSVVCLVSGGKHFFLLCLTVFHTSWARSYSGFESVCRLSQIIILIMLS